jgi:hypothetical protein
MGIMLGVLGDFFRNYGTPFATAVAIVNTVITVIISYFFFRVASVPNTYLWPHLYFLVL